MKIFMDLDEVVAALSISRSGVRRMLREDDFPKPRELTPRRIGWLVEEVQEWARNRPAADMLPPPNRGQRREP